MHQFYENNILEFGHYLQDQERSCATVQKYLRAVERFYHWLPEGKCIDKQSVICYKETLLNDHVPGGVNVILAALNGFFRFMGWQDCIVRALHIQRKVFSAPETELTRQEYLQLVKAARKKQDIRLSLLLQLMASTGIRVSEIQYLTAEALKQNRIQIHLKGKIRTILLPGKLYKKLRQYQHCHNIQTGPIFRGQNGKALDRRSIWAQMKRLCEAANVPKTKVFPHNLRHLFARTFYEVQRDITKLADVLGHSSIETTRIYLLSSGQEHQKILDGLCLVC